MYSSFNPYASADATATLSSQPDASIDDPASQDKSSQDKDADEEAPKGNGKQAEADKEYEEVFKRPLPVSRSNPASKQTDVRFSAKFISLIFLLRRLLRKRSLAVAKMHLVATRTLMSGF